MPVNGGSTSRASLADAESPAVVLLDDDDRRVGIVICN